MTPEDRYTLQQALFAMEEAASALRKALYPPVNPNLPDDYAQRLREGVTGMKQCICDFGWQPECPRHGEVQDHQDERPRTGVTIKPAFPAKTPEQEAEDEAAAQRLDAAIRAEKATAAKADRDLPAPPPWYGQVDTDTEDRLLIRAHLPGVEHFNEPPADPAPPGPPTPKDVFGGR